MDPTWIWLLLTQQPGDYDGGGRNLFDYGRIAPPPPTPEELARRARLAEEARLAGREGAQAPRGGAGERCAWRHSSGRRSWTKSASNAAPPTAPMEPPKPVPPDFPYKFIGVMGRVRLEDRHLCGQ